MKMRSSPFCSHHLKIIEAYSILYTSFFIGVQTLGGIFARTMKITSRQETKLTELYSAAAVELSKVNASASSSVTENSSRVGFLGLGGRYV